jgi:hypothetical protein
VKRFLAASLLLAGAAACTDELDGQQRIGRADAWAITAASPLGPPLSCVDQARIRGHAVRDARTVDFTMDDGSLLRNRLPFACPALLQGARITYRTALPRLCSTDTIVLSAAGNDRSAVCGLGQFQPVAVPPQAAAR